VHAFYGAGSNGSEWPDSLVLVGASGAMVGTAEVGGEYDRGTIFLVTPPSTPGGAWSYDLMYSFQGTNDGAEPMAVVTSGGAIYGVLYDGGLGVNNGTLFELVP
jgi:hypothetical protein